MKIGIIVATEKEQQPFEEIFGKPHSYHFGTYDVTKYLLDLTTAVFLVRSGFGEIAATSATQYLIDRFQVEAIINYGAVGSLRDDHRIGEIGFISKVVHYDFDISATGHYGVGEYPGKGTYLQPIKDAVPKAVMRQKHLTEFVCASADKFVAGGRLKRELRKDFNADVCDMETAGILLTCNKNNVPVTFIKTISDGVDEGSEAFNRNVYNVSLGCVEFLYETFMTWSRKT